MNPRPIIITSLCAILFVAAIYFGGRLQLQQERIDDPPAMSKTKRPVDKAPKPTASPINTPTTNTTNDQHQTSVTQHPAPAVDTEVDTSAVGAETPETTPTEASTAEVPTSPFGFGPYPQIPDDCPYNPIWTDARKGSRERMSNGQIRNFELMGRVRIKLWNQGHRFDSATLSYDGSRMYPLEPMTVYVKWTEFIEDDGTISRYSSSTTAHGSIPDTDLDQIEEGIIPPGYKVLSLDEDYINPLEFLNLN